MGLFSDMHYIRLSVDPGNSITLSAAKLDRDISTFPSAMPEDIMPVGLSVEAT